MQAVYKGLIIVGSILAALFILAALGNFGIPKGKGPNPTEVLRVFADLVNADVLVQTLDILSAKEEIGKRIDKKAQKIKFDDGSEIDRFLHYELAYWYPHKRFRILWFWFNSMTIRFYRCS